MRNARTLLRHGRPPLAALLLGGVCCFGWGCHQHHYYYGPTGANGCPPAIGTTVLPSNVAVGEVCEVPSEVAVPSPVVGARSTVVDDGRTRPRVVVSEPARRSSRFGWRSTNPEDVPAFTQIDGALNSTVK
ncbi:hypothetical protein [Planctomyces sp. SH-PL62]|uniref:hypothetical protein n=1 Tax=Planctomyces sp. SH-PL62 TaxID=1636152 RepID=UPI00078E45AF|nr:hypothetical protein [Planctomyces sp. SH-PL62]AMV36230.1 hypothetical protein VT85_02220 [Planctomyces sp. SH-PL62]